MKYNVNLVGMLFQRKEGFNLPKTNKLDFFTKLIKSNSRNFLTKEYFNPHVTKKLKEIYLEIPSIKMTL